LGWWRERNEMNPIFWLAPVWDFFAKEILSFVKKKLIKEESDSQSSVIKTGGDIKEVREDLINFLRRLYDSKWPTIPDPQILYDLIQSYRKEIGLYRFSKLHLPLKEMKICNFLQVASGPPVPSLEVPNYSKADIEKMILSVENGGKHGKGGKK
jgi:hypothetical protein